jgi:hypothetical protein
MVIFQLDVVHKWPNKLPLKSMDEKSSPSLAHRPGKGVVIHKPQNGSGGIKGLSYASV